MKKTIMLLSLAQLIAPAVYAGNACSVGAKSMSCIESYTYPSTYRRVSYSSYS